MTRQQRVAAEGPSSATAATSGGAPAQRPFLTLDALGKKCPIPIIMLADRIGEVPVGRIIEVLADDPAAKTDLPAWCALKSQEFVRADTLAVEDSRGNPKTSWSFLVRRSY